MCSDLKRRSERAGLREDAPHQIVGDEHCVEKLEVVHNASEGEERAREREA